MIAARALDAALERIAAEASRIDIVSRKPMSYADVTAHSLGHVTAFKVTQPKADKGYRCAEVIDIGEGMTTGQGKPAYWALTGKGHLLACAPMPDARAVVPGLPFRLPPLALEIEPVEVAA